MPSPTVPATLSSQLRRLGLVRAAAAQYDVAPLADWAAYERRISAWVDEAALAGARLLLFPEYFAMELASLFGPEVPLSLPRQLSAMQELLADFLALFARLARTHGACIVAGSYPVRLADGSYRNRCHLFHPDGRRMFQDKLQMTRFETEEWHIGAGDTLKVFHTAFGRIGIPFPQLDLHVRDLPPELTRSQIPSAIKTEEAKTDQAG